MVKSTFIASLALGYALNSVSQIDDANTRQSWAQTQQQTQNIAVSKHVAPGDVRFHMDKRIEKLDSLKRLNPTGMEGYRVQIFFGDRKEAQAKRVAFLRDYPDVSAYISYLAPNFRVRVGDFRTRLESEKFKNEISTKYLGTYIVKDEIEFPLLGTVSAEQ